MKTELTIGKLIEQEVRKQQIDIVKFAEMINCTRTNVYKIFDKSSIHLDQLVLISKVLKRNFLQDIAEDLSLIDIESVEAQREMENRKADSQFREVVPMILRRMGIEPIIAFGKPLEIDNNADLPDYLLTNYGIAFTIGSFFKDKVKLYGSDFLEFIPKESSDGIKVYLMKNKVGNSMIDVKLDYKSEESWEETLKFVFDIYKKEILL